MNNVHIDEMTNVLVFPFFYLLSSKDLVLFTSATHAHGHTLNLVISNNFNSSIFLISGILPSNYHYFFLVHSF